MAKNESSNSDSKIFGEKIRPEGSTYPVNNETNRDASKGGKKGGK